MTTSLRVHLDHLIKRQSLRYSPPKNLGAEVRSTSHRSDQNIRFDDIKQEDGWFNRIVKPDFQRATCAWDPEACVTFLRSVLNRRIIPSIILWRSNETGLVYVLDGAHRLSVLRAWMIDDWGDRAGEFYGKKDDVEEVMQAAYAARDAVNQSIGPFNAYEEAHAELNRIVLAGGAPMQLMSEERARMARFYLDSFGTNRTLHAQWEDGDYAAAEESFLAINRQGVRLDDLESLLIEYRNGSMARVIMSIANAGAAGHYWPEPPASEPLTELLTEKLSTFDDRCAVLHRTMFVPPFDTTIRDINVPMIVAPGHFRLQQVLIELLPLLAEGMPIDADGTKKLLGRDSERPVQDMILNADKLIGVVESKLEHIGGRGNGSRSLALVPLIYWFNRRGVFVRALMYGWLHWLLSGSNEEVQTRKILLSSVRGELEDTLTRYKDEFAEIQHRAGAGFKSLSKITNFIQQLIGALLETRRADDETRANRVAALLEPKSSKVAVKGGKTRSFSRTSRAEINVRTLLGAPVRCEICGGVVDLKQGVQYDHKQLFSRGGASVSDNGRATHPFCNLFRERIEKLRSGRETATLPPLSEVGGAGPSFRQLNLFDALPGE